jgi:ribonuclease T1
LSHRARGAARRGSWHDHAVLRRALVLLLALVGVAVLAGCGGVAAPQAGSAGAGGDGVAAADGLPPSDTDPDSGLPWVLEAELPPSGQETLALIDDGGPFPYDKDGSTFQNREGILPAADLGYYAEYTVPKPGEDDRGPWRLVTGADGEVYWTADHYSSFARVWR